MRTKLMILAALIGFCLCANAENVKKTYDLSFNGIEVTSGFDIQLIKDDTHSVTVEVDSEYAPYLSVTTESGILKVRFKKLPVKMQMQSRKADFKMTIRTPMINFIDLSGACKLECKDEFSLGMNNFRVTLSGASNIVSLKVNSIDASFRLSGASKANIDGEFGDFEVYLEGASKMTYNGSCSDLDAKVLSSSDYKMTGPCPEVNLEVKGASKAELVGNGEELDAEVAGASKLKAEEFHVSSAKIDAKGASNVTIDASESLKADVSGAASVKYRDRSGLRLNPMVSGGGTFKTL